MVFFIFSLQKSAPKNRTGPWPHPPRRHQKPEDRRHHVGHRAGAAGAAGAEATADAGAEAHTEADAKGQGSAHAHADADTW